MYGQPGISQEWSVHAQLTISHRRPVDGVDMPAAATPAPPPEQDSGGVHMAYSWGGQPTSPPPSTAPSSSNIPPRTCYGFQRGNILFTTRPPNREPQGHPHQTSTDTATTFRSGQQRLGTTHLLDSGYNSEQVSPGSYASLPTRRPSQAYNRRCKSTCSIVLSGSESQGISSASMRPSVDTCPEGYMQDAGNAVFYPSGYKCGDPVCYHQHQTSPLSSHKPRPRSSDFVSLPETCEVCGGGRSPTAIRRASAANTFTTHFCTRVPERVPRESQDVETRPSRDVASQTSDHMISATAPDLEVTPISKSKPVQPKMGNKVVYGGARRKTDSELLQLPVINIPEPDVELKKPASSKRLSRSPARRLARSPARLRGQSPLLPGATGRKSQGSQCTPNQPLDRGQRKPRTVHIDVYCTGSEDADASGSSDDSEELSDSLSSPQTVLETDKLRVVHARIGKDRLPAGYVHRQQQQREEKISGITSRRSESFKYETSREAEEQQVARGYDSDDGLSSHYPSQMSSCSTLQGATDISVPQSEVTTTTTSRDPSWSTISSSSIALSDEYDSAAATSWKDTVTDLDSLVQSTLSLAQSESFEYADSADRLRIREKERAWAGSGGNGEDSKTWRSPHVERKHLLQQQKFKEFLEKHLGKSAFPVWKAETTEDSDDDETGDAWSFCDRETETFPRPAGKPLKREDTVKRVDSGKGKEEVRVVTSAKGAVAAKASSLLKTPSIDTGSLSDSGPHRFIRRTVIGPFGYKTPSPPPSKVVTSVTSPFTNIPGKRTDQLSKAEKFGTIVGAFRKPGHHVGPSKNPECACEHCRKYYEDSGYRTRTRSVGDMPLDNVNGNWKRGLNVQSGVNVAGRESDLETSSITEDASTDNEKSVKHFHGLIDSEDDQ